MDVSLSQFRLRRLDACAGLLDPGAKILPADRLRALTDAREIIEAADERGRRIVGEALAAYEAERQRGYAEGQDQARKEQAAQVIENVSRRIDFLEKAEDRIVEIVMRAVRKIIEGFDDVDRTVAAVRSVLAIARDQKQVTLRLSPERVDDLKARIDALMADYPGVEYIDVVPEKRLSGDACVLESEMGVIEASIEIQLAAIQEAFDKTLGRGG